MAQLQGWAVHISWCADHTYVECPDLGKYFQCWGLQQVPGQVLVTTGDGNYPVANCYRCPVDLFGTIYPDTACIGAYGVNGVCHQSANCFLITAGTTLNFQVRGYWFSLLMYGTYGNFWLFWAVLGGCLLSAGVEVPTAEELAMASNPSLPDQIRDLYEKSKNEKPAPSHNEMLMREAALVTKFYAPDVDPAHFRDLHATLLAHKDEAIRSGATGAELAAKLNAVAAEHQGHLAARLGAEAYQKLMGAAPGETLNIIEPDAEPATGVAPPKTTPEGDA